MSRKHIHTIRALILVTALVFIVLGVARSDHSTVLRKAMRICLECIGVGA